MQDRNEQWKSLVARFFNICVALSDVNFKEEFIKTKIITLIKEIQILKSSELVPVVDKPSFFWTNAPVKNRLDKDESVMSCNERTNQIETVSCDAIVQIQRGNRMDKQAKKDTNQIALEKYKELMNLFENKNFYRDFKTALDNHFEVMLMAPMSSGKSTLINAMLGFDLLPTANQACTATVYRIEDNDAMKTYKCRAAFGDNITPNWVDASPQLLNEWNSKGDCSVVEIEGNLPFVQNTGAKLVLYDTPGPNFSCDRRHSDTLSKALDNHKFGVIVFLLNANNLGTEDEKTMLNQILEIRKSNKKFNKRTVFIVSKADQFDEEDGEDLKRIIKDVKSYLIKAGFKSPKIIPVMAEAALLARKLTNNMKLSKHEQIDLRNYIDKIKTTPKSVYDSTVMDKLIMDKIEAGITGKGDLISQNVQGIASFRIHKNDSISRQELNRFLYSTGLHTLELYFEHLITQEALPNTMVRVSKTLKSYDAMSLFNWIKSE